MAVLALNAQFEKEASANPELAAIKLKAADARTQIDAAKQEMTKAATQRDLVQKQVSTMLTYVNNPNAARSALITKQQALASLTSQIQMLKARLGPTTGDPAANPGVVANPNAPIAPVIIPINPDSPAAPVIIPIVPEIGPLPNGNTGVPTGVPIITAPIPIGF
jgi:hypothetical protein